MCSDRSVPPQESQGIDVTAGGSCVPTPWPPGSQVTGSSAVADAYATSPTSRVDRKSQRAKAYERRSAKSGSAAFSLLRRFRDFAKLTNCTSSVMQ